MSDIDQVLVKMYRRKYRLFSERRDIPTTSELLDISRLGSGVYTKVTLSSIDFCSSVFPSGLVCSRQFSFVPPVLVNSRHHLSPAVVKSHKVSLILVGFIKSSHFRSFNSFILPCFVYFRLQRLILVYSCNSCLFSLTDVGFIKFFAHSCSNLSLPLALFISVC